jgi:streptogramin lyase
MARDLGVTRDFLAPNVASASKIQQISSDRFLSRGLFNNNTGNVQQEQPWYDVQVPDWTTGSHVTNWSTLQQYLSGVAATNSLVPVSAFYVEKFGSFPGVGAYATAVVAPNGLIYMPANNNSVGRIINPSNNTVTTYGSFFPAVNAAIHGGVLTTNGLIYCTPYNQSTASITNPSNNTTTTFGSFPGAASGWGVGTALAPNGKVYMIPFYGTVFAVVDPLANNPTSVQFFGSVPSLSVTSGILAPNGKIYCGAYSRTYGVIVDPNTNTLSSYGPIPNQVYTGGIVLAPSGKIYMIPTGNTGNSIVVVLDPETNSIVKTFSGITGNGTTPYSGSVIDSAGRIFLIPHDATTGLVIDTNNDSTYRYGNSSFFPGSQAYEGAIVAPNEKIYFVPYSATSGICINTVSNNNWNLNIITNPFFNRTNN